MTRLLILIILLTSNHLLCQTTLTKDSFFLEQKSLPKDYKSIITDTQWLYIGSWKSNIKKIYIPDSIRTIDLMLFEDRLERRRKSNRKVVITDDTASLWKTVKIYRRIEGKNIVSNTGDFATQEIIYVDSSTLILETKDKKNVHRSLYRRQK